MSDAIVLEGIAIGYLRTDVSGDSFDLHKAAIEHLAKRWGYDVKEIVLADEHTPEPIEYLKAIARVSKADAVFTLSARHFDGCTVPADLIAVCDVVTVADKQTFARQIPSPFEFRSVTPPNKETK
ncbi:hypothetical protein [Nocardia ignorata]|uniref:Resolvase-like protein n=1 Tax=Nocardia ignorata TaxID=145285 RepID=A0A4R6P0E5_NOCIG|nr:hypothetical protein [Nocardia ignorata]TDP29855.1 hypothetical protein DFR75_112124 [Nocardia ignorata]